MTIADVVLVALIALHLAISFVHGAAHTGAAVPLSAAATLFVWVVILVGPAVNREWTPALIGVALWAAWIVVAGLGRSAMR